MSRRAAGSVAACPSDSHELDGWSQTFSGESLCGRRGRDGHVQRQPDHEHSTMALRVRAALYTNRPAVLMDDFSSEPQSQAGADLFVCGEEALKDLTKAFAVNPAAVVRDGCTKTVAVRGRADAKLAAGTHRIQRVADEVAEDLPQLIRISIYFGFGSIGSFNFYPTRPDFSAEHSQHSFDHVSEIDPSRIGVVPVEAQSLFSNMVDPR